MSAAARVGLYILIGAVCGGGVWMYRRHIAAQDEQQLTSRGSVPGSGGEPASAPGLQPARFLAGHADGTLAVAFSPKGDRLLTASHDGTARLWDGRDGQPIRNFVGHRAAVRSVAFAPDGGRIATGGTDGEIMIWDAEGGNLLYLMDARYSVAGIVFLTDGTLLTASADGIVRWWDVESETAIEQAPVPGGQILALAVTPDGSLALASTEGAMMIGLDLKSRSVLWASRSPAAAFTIAISADGKRAFAGSYTGNVQQWDVSTGKPLGSLENIAGFAVALLGDGKLLCGGSDGLGLWDLQGAQPKRLRFLISTELIHAVASDPSGRLVAAAEGGSNLTDGGWRTAASSKVPVWDLGR